MRIFHKRKFTQRKFYFINFRIEALELRVLDGKGEQIGVMSKQEALNKAQELEADLVLIAPKAVPPVAKIIDFKKFLYQEEKKEKDARKGIKKGVVKDINLGLFIGQADLERMEKRSKEFLSEGHQVRINLLLRGRENAKRDMAFALVNKFIVSLGEVNISKEPKLEGKIFDFIDAVSQKNTRKAVRLLERERAAGSADGYLGQMLLRQVRLLLGARSLLDQNPSIQKADVAKELGIHPFVAQKSVTQARNFKLEDLIRAHDLLFDFDQKTKQGVDPGLAVERVMVEMLKSWDLPSLADG